MNNQPPKQVVIIGGGYAGVTFAQELQKQVKASEAKIVLIEKRQFFFNAVGSLRAIVDEKYRSKVFIPLKDAFPAKQSKGWFCAKNSQPPAHRLVHGIAEKIEATHVEVRLMGENDVGSDKTEQIKYDYLILATGSLYSAPIKPGNGVDTQQEITQQYKEIGDKIKAAKSVMIIGAGAVGVEMAGEVACQYPDKKVMLIDGNDQLLSRQNLTQKFRSKLMAAVQKQNIEIILGDKFVERLTEHGLQPRTVQLASGRKIESDVQILCAGMSPCSKLVKHFDESLLDDKNFVKVLPNLQLDGKSNIYCIGDASNHDSPKMAFLADLQAKFLAKQLPLLMRAKIEVLPAFKGLPGEAILVTLGSSGGVVQLPFFGGMVLGNLVASMKAKDLFASRYLQQMNAKQS
eukprot:TRINITY_DN1074_c0_g1_i2.p3 TRINITY_DN1074_c0_g1~~TRINITY_DN1074_c0_g1_i2.p3  ORF type:complete len:402 (+),score=83.88 TRINITY_DN1074_c0_g1_i2:156-1361(+)